MRKEVKEASGQFDEKNCDCFVKNDRRFKKICHDLAAENLKLKNEAVHLNAVILNLKTERKMSRKLQLAENRARDRKQILFVIFLVDCCSLYALTALL
jgi:hypothetical protein